VQTVIAAIANWLWSARPVSLSNPLCSRVWEHGTLPKDLPEEPPACICNIFDPQTGALTLNGHFRDPGSERVGVSMDGKSWPNGFHGDAYPHGTVFSRPAAPVKSASTGN
jgi:hypothetical protein